MINVLGRLILFLSSYTPLFVIIGIKTFSASRPAGVGLVAIGLLAGGAMLALLAWSRTINVTPVKVLTATSASEDVVAYLFTYILPVLGVSTNGAADIFALVILFITIGLVFMNSNLGLVNPMLAGAGFHLHRIETPGKSRYIMLSRHDTPPVEGTDVRVRRLGDWFGLEASS
jgi:hypothetical protein